MRTKVSQLFLGLLVGTCLLAAAHGVAAAQDCTAAVSEADRAVCEAQDKLRVAKQHEAAAQRDFEAARKAQSDLPSSAKPESLAAAQTRVDDTKRKLNEAIKQREDAEEALKPKPASVPEKSASTETATCKNPLVICLDRNGDLYADTWPGTVQVGDKLTVLVVTTENRAVEDRAGLSVTFQGRKSTESLLPGGVPAGAAAAPQDPGKAQNAIVTLAYPSDPVGEDIVNFAITFAHPRLTDSPGVSLTQVIHVDLGYSYYNVALLVAATFKGDRRTFRDLSTVSDHAVEPALALVVFPGGRERGILGYARRGEAGGWRWLANNIGVQIGADLDFTDPTDKLYAGVVFEPVAGLAVAGGVTLRKVSVIPSMGGLPALEAMDGTAPSDQRYVVRGYVGVTLTLDLLKTISSIGTSIRGVPLP